MQEKATAQWQSSGVLFRMHQSRLHALCVLVWRCPTVLPRRKTKTPKVVDHVVIQLHKLRFFSSEDGRSGAWKCLGLELGQLGPSQGPSQGLPPGLPPGEGSPAPLRSAAHVGSLGGRGLASRRTHGTERAQAAKGEPVAGGAKDTGADRQSQERSLGMGPGRLGDGLGMAWLSHHSSKVGDFCSSVLVYFGIFYGVGWEKRSP